MGRFNKAVQTVPEKDDTSSELKLNTHTEIKDKRAQDVHMISSPEMRSILMCLGEINENLKKLVIMTGEIVDVEGEEL